MSRLPRLVVSNRAQNRDREKQAHHDSSNIPSVDGNAVIPRDVRTRLLPEGDRNALLLGGVPALLFYPIAIFAAFRYRHLSTDSVPWVADGLSQSDVCALFMLGAAGFAIILASIPFFGETGKLTWRGGVLLVLVQIAGVAALVGANILAATPAHS